MLVGVDGGGTHTVAVASRLDGTVVAYARGLGINYNSIGMTDARKNLRALLDSMPQVSAHGCLRMCVGLSALDGPADAAAVQAFAGQLFDPASLDLHSDAYVALLGLTLGEPGLIIICGTGSMLMAMDRAGRQHVLGGWGHLLGDVGSSHALAVEGLRAAIDGLEAVGDPTALTEAALAHFGAATPRALIPRVYAPDVNPPGIAQFAKEVLRLEATDAVAGDIVRRQMNHVARQAERLLGDYPEIKLVGLCGGIFAHHPRVYALLKRLLLAHRPDITVTTPRFPPELGALICLLRGLDALTPPALSRMQESYEAIVSQTGRIAL